MSSNLTTRIKEVADGIKKGYLKYMKSKNMEVETKLAGNDKSESKAEAEKGKRSIDMKEEIIEKERV